MASSYKTAAAAMTAAKKALFEPHEVEIVAVAGGKFMWAEKKPDPADATETADTTEAVDAAAISPPEPDASTEAAAISPPEPDAAEAAAAIDPPEAAEGESAEVVVSIVDDAAQGDVPDADEPEPEAPEPDTATDDAVPADGGDAELDAAVAAALADAPEAPAMDGTQPPLSDREAFVIRCCCNKANDHAVTPAAMHRHVWLSVCHALETRGLMETVQVAGDAPGDFASTGYTSRFRLTDEGKALCPLAAEMGGYKAPPARERVIFVIEDAGWVDPAVAAASFAKKIGYVVIVRNAETGDQIHVADPKAVTPKAPKAARTPADPKAPKEPKAAKAPKSDQPTGHLADTIRLARRPEGVTREQLRAEVIDKNMAWTTMLKNAAERFGYVYDAVTGADRRTTYFLRDAPAAAQAA